MSSSLSASLSSAAAADARIDAQLDILFTLFAKDTSGGEAGMGVEELTNFLRALDSGACEREGDGSGRGASAELASVLAATLVGRYDSRNIGLLTPADFRLLLASEGLPGIAGAPIDSADTAAAELARVFMANDLDGDGLLDRHDVRRMVESADGRIVTDAEVDEILEQAGDDVGETHMTLGGFYELSKAQW